MPPNDYACAVLDIEPATRHEIMEVRPPDPFIVLVLAEFSGARSKDCGSPVPIDRDNFDQVIARFAPELNFTVADTELNLRFSELEDFHPDSLYRRVNLFRHAAATAATPGPGLLDRILAGALVPAEPASTAPVAGEVMRAILHHAEFQKLEAAWRGVHFLVRRIETGPNLKIFIADPGASGEIPSVPGDSAWSVIVADRVFSRSEASLLELSRLGVRAMTMNAALLAEAEPPGDDAEENARWKQFRHRPEAAHIGLASPRLLARMPYGESGQTTDDFTFEELDSPPRHTDYLWMNPAFGAACLLASEFERYGWSMHLSASQDIDRLPLHVYREHGEAVAKPCAEILLREVEVEQLLEEGLMPVVAFRDTDRARLARFQSIAEPPRQLAGPWEFPQLGNF